MDNLHTSLYFCTNDVVVLVGQQQVVLDEHWKVEQLGEELIQDFVVCCPYLGEDPSSKEVFLLLVGGVRQYLQLNSMQVKFMEPSNFERPSPYQYLAMPQKFIIAAKSSSYFIIPLAQHQHQEQLPQLHDHPLLSPLQLQE